MVVMKTHANSSTGISHYRRQIIVIQPEGFLSRFLIHSPLSLLHLHLHLFLHFLLFQLCLHLTGLGSSRTGWRGERWRRERLRHSCDRGVRDVSLVLSILLLPLPQPCSLREGWGFGGGGRRFCSHGNDAAKIQ